MGPKEPQPNESLGPTYPGRYYDITSSRSQCLGGIAFPDIFYEIFVCSIGFELAITVRI
jgi:hypothetical protein